MKKSYTGWPLQNNKNLIHFIIVFFLLSNIFIPLTSGQQGDDIDLQIKGKFRIIGDLIEGTMHIIKATIYNAGTDNITTPFKVALYVDQQRTFTFTIPSLKKQTERPVNLSWIATKGSHQLSVFVDPDDDIEDERDESNNRQDRNIFIDERKTDLAFQPRKFFFQDRLRAAQKNTIYANVINLGRNTTKTINASFYVDGDLIQYKYIKGLTKNTIYNLSFEWTPNTYGEYTINITLDKKDFIDEYNDSNNWLEDTVTVGVAHLEWWHYCWHYRKFYNINGQGNISIDLDFPSYLTLLGIPDSTLENDTITIIKYHNNGTVDKRITNFTYNETSQQLIWETQNGYYCIYFDVEENIGNRPPTPELPTMNTSGSPEIAFTEPPEGWATEQAAPLPYYLPFREPFTLEFNTTAIAQMVTAEFYLEGEFENSELFYTLNGHHWTLDIEFTPQQRGNWTININANDHAGYHSNPLTCDLYVGYPDIIMESISFTPTVTPSNPFYQGRQLTITATTRVFHTTVDNANITLEIDGEFVDIHDNLFIQKDETITVEFKKYFNQSGKYNISVIVDQKDDINEKNNEQWKILIVEGIPDLDIVKIYLTNQTVTEGDPVDVFVEVKNIGNGNATNYQLNLYLEQDENNTMTYSEPKNSTTISVNINESKNISITWPSAAYGEEKFKGKWITGALIIWTKTKPDSDIFNNNEALYDPRLKVIPVESNPPTITLSPIPDRERYEKVVISARINDESGIKRVEFTITNPDGLITTEEMTESNNEYYNYEFTETETVGTYNLTITAWDNSIHSDENPATITRTFRITPDKTAPTIGYYGVSPKIQLPEKDVLFTCIVSDLSGIRSVKISIENPEGKTDEISMKKGSTNGKYTYTSSYETIGKYTFTITAEDEEKNKETSQQKHLWITNDLNDADNDGLPDWWEAKYGLDMYDPTDADDDPDDDGLTNSEEFEKGTNPLKAYSASELLRNLEDNAAYFAASLIIFIILLIFAIVALRRL